MISFIVPIYNAEAYIARCIESLLAQQTDEPLQFILVDDESTDSGLAIARSYAKKDQRIEIYTQSHAGQSAARNKGMTHAKGEYIAFVDADDSIAPDWSKQHLEAINGVDYVQSGYVRVQGSEIQKQKLPRNRYQFTSPCMRLYHRSAIAGLLFQEGMIYEDVLWSVDLWLRDLTCKLVSYSGYRYTYNPRSTTSQAHPDAEQRVLSALREKSRTASRRGKLIILYTLIRLKLHFLLA